jgi:hypothetical protein
VTKTMKSAWAGILMLALVMLIGADCGGDKGDDKQNDQQTNDEQDTEPTSEGVTSGQACQGKVPPGCVVTCTYVDPTCPNGKKDSYACLDGLPSGSQITCCDSNPIPSGWTLVSRLYLACCGLGSPNAMIIKKD